MLEARIGKEEEEEREIGQRRKRKEEKARGGTGRMRDKAEETRRE